MRCISRVSKKDGNAACEVNKLFIQSLFLTVKLLQYFMLKELAMVFST